MSAVVVTIADETPKETLREFHLELVSERITARDLIRRRVRAEHVHVGALRVLRRKPCLLQEIAQPHAGERRLSHRAVPPLKTGHPRHVKPAAVASTVKRRLPPSTPDRPVSVPDALPTVVRSIPGGSTVFAPASEKSSMGVCPAAAVAQKRTLTNSAHTNRLSADGVRLRISLTAESPCDQIPRTSGCPLRASVARRSTRARSNSGFFHLAW